MNDALAQIGTRHAPPHRARGRPPGGGPNHDSARALRTVRGLFGAAATAALILGAPATASAATTATFDPGTGVLSVSGDAGNNTITISRDAGGTIFVNGGAVPVTGGTPTTANTTRIELYGGQGNDVLELNEAGGPLPAAHLFGGSGDDTLRGGSGTDLLDGGSGNDTIDGNRGNDTAVMGSGNDVFIWDPGDGSDVVEGQTGFDTLRFNGSGAAENIDVSANGQRVRFFRDVGSITMDLNDVERIEFNALGGADTIVVNPLNGTDAQVVALDLASSLGGTSGDGQADTVIVNGTAGNDNVAILQIGGAVVASGLAARVEVRNAEAALDTLRVNGLDGDDSINAGALSAGLVKLVLDGGAGNDLLIGSLGDDVLDGGPGSDTLIGGPGTDVGLNGEVLIGIP